MSVFLFQINFIFAIKQHAVLQLRICNYISQTVQDGAKVTIEHEYNVTCALS